jgi:hypothetical protein
MYTMLGHGGSCATLPPPPPPSPPLEDDDSFNEFLDELNDNQACEVPANELQPAIVASFRMQRLEGNNTKTVKEVNQVLLERAMGVSADMRVYGEAERRRFYCEAEGDITYSLFKTKSTIYF